MSNDRGTALANMLSRFQMFQPKICSVWNLFNLLASVVPDHCNMQEPSYTEVLQNCLQILVNVALLAILLTTDVCVPYFSVPYLCCCRRVELH